MSKSINENNIDELHSDNSNLISTDIKSMQDTSTQTANKGENVKDFKPMQNCNEKTDKYAENLDNDLENKDGDQGDFDKLNPEELNEGEYIICPGCGEKMPKTIHTCVTCGGRLKHSTYTPISEKKAASIRMIVGVVLLIVFFIVWFLVISK